MAKLQADMFSAKEALRRSEETAELLAEKNRLAEEEAILLSHKANEVEQEISIIRMTARKTEEEKIHLEKRTKEAEIITNHLFEESKRKAAEAECLKNELILARVSEKEAKERLLTFLSQSSNTISRNNHFPLELGNLKIIFDISNHLVRRKSQKFLTMYDSHRQLAKFLQFFK